MLYYYVSSYRGGSFEQEGKGQCELPFLWVWPNCIHLYVCKYHSQSSAPPEGPG